ncbi:MAG: hypothetical protein NTY08_16010 [Proteobacteria bacterium]|nr:hypothetical protein [Pseudomonadota bacterium]
MAQMLVSASDVNERIFFYSNAAEAVCPDGVNAWRQWQQEVVQTLVRSSFTNEFTGPYLQMRACKTSLKSLGHDFKCFFPLLSYYERINRSKTKGYSLGFDVSDESYIKEVEQLVRPIIPPVLLSQSFLEDVSAVDQLVSPRALAVVEQLNHVNGTKSSAVVFNSRHLPSVDNARTFGRLLVWVETDRADLFIQYAIGSSNPTVKPSSIGVIAVFKKFGERQLANPIAYFIDFMRTFQNSEIVVTTRLAQQTILDGCYGCHKSPLIPISPDMRHFSVDKFGQALSEINSAMSGFGAAEIAHLDKSGYGPPIGVENRLSDSEIIKCSGTNKLNDLDIKAVRDSIKCNSCHNGNDRAELTYPSALPNQLPGQTSLVDSFVVGAGLMPPSFDSTSLEVRKAIANCVRHTYYGKNGRLEEWLMQARCFEDKSPQ